MNFEITLEFVLQLLGAGGVGFAAAFGAFKYFSKAWLDNKFSERLELFKHKQEIEIQRMRVEIDSALTGALRVQEREFETLTETWSKLEDAFGWVASLISAMHELPYLDGMSTEELDEFLVTTELLETQKKKIRISDNKLKTYTKFAHWHQMNDVRKRISDFDTSVARYGIFFPNNIYEKLSAIGAQLRITVIGYEDAFEESDFKMRSKIRKTFEEEAKPLLQEVELMIRTRIHSYGSLSNEV